VEIRIVVGLQVVVGDGSYGRQTFFVDEVKVACDGVNVFFGQKDRADLALGPLFVELGGEELRGSGEPMPVCV